jgi:ATP-dependent helicase/nuclease subunit B
MKCRYQWLDAALADGGIVVTANRRLHRELVKVHGERQLDAGRKAWPTPDIHFIANWLGLLFENGDSDAALPLRINAQSSTVIWERCVESSLHEPLPGRSGVVRQCRQAWSRLQEWCVPLDEVIRRSSGTEQKLFAAAAQRYSETLSGNKWIDDGDLIGNVTRSLSDSSAKPVKTLPLKICFAGFDRISPAQEALRAVLRINNVTIADAVMNATSGAITATCKFDQAAELRAAGAWARSELLNDPTLRLAIVCPDLESDAAQVTRLVREGFVPGWQYSPTRYRDAVDVSYGKPLSDYPAIRVALMLLRWVHDGLKSHEISILMRSNAIDAGSSAARSRLEQRLRRIPDRLWGPEDLLVALSRSPENPDEQAWNQSVRKISETQKHYRENASPAQWAERFDHFLSSAGWPGVKSKDSHEFQLLNRWRNLLNEFAVLNRVEPALRFSTAVSRLAQLASDSIFQPEADHDVLPVLGVLEASGMEFDKIWISAFDARHWPAPGNQLTFISRQLQRDHNMPDSSPDDTLKFSRQQLQRLISSANEIVVSWAMTEGDVPLQVSPLYDELSVTANVDEVDPGWFASSMYKSELLTMVAQDPVPPVHKNEEVGGGAYTVQRQASDPFSAFAHGRLRVNDLQAFQSGLPARVRGSAIHAALSGLLSEHPSQSDLRQWSDSDLAKRAAVAARKSLLHLNKNADSSLRRIIELEQRRIENIIIHFAQEEQLRENFQVAMTEHKLVYSGHGLRLNLRVDRVDIMDDESALIIDYKTGAEKGLTNRDDGLYDLQLMVYAFALQKDYPIGGIGIINLDTRKISFKKAVQDEKWDERFSRWGEVTDSAIESLAKGDASINTGLNSDQTRPLSILSRIEELRRGK